MTGYNVKNRVLKLMKGFIFLLIPLSGVSQFNLFRNFNVKDGLPSSEVYEMLEDSKGYFWFATDMGVSRFNGYAFENFSTENGLPDNTIYGIYEDHKKNIWFRSLSGKLSYYKNKGIQTLPCNNDLVHVLKNLTVTSLFVDSKDTVWVGVNSNFVLKIAPGRHRQDVIKDSIPHDG
jgi:ligand-binding sensor domain-containing protein